MTASTAALDPAAAAAERKRKRLEAWRRRQQQQQPSEATPASASTTSPPPPFPPPPPQLPPPLPPPPSSMPPPLPPPQLPPVLPPAAPLPTRMEKTKVKLAIGLSAGIKNKRKKKKKSEKPEDVEETKKRKLNAFEDEEEEEDTPTTKRRILSLEETDTTTKEVKKKRNRWDKSPSTTTATTIETPPTMPVSTEAMAHDALDQFMTKLEAGAMGSVAIQQQQQEQANELHIDVSGSMMRLPKASTTPVTTPVVVSGGVITAEELKKLTSLSKKKKKREESTASTEALFTASDWESDAPNRLESETEPETEDSETETDDEEEEKARRAFVEALKQSSVQKEEEEEEDVGRGIQLASDIKSEKQRREIHLQNLHSQVNEAKRLLSQTTQIGRLYNDTEGGIMEEAERHLGVLTAAPDALEVLAELNKKKELKAVDHSVIDYIPVRKNLYIVPRAHVSFTPEDIGIKRAALSIQVRGRGAPAPVTTFAECGLSERILSILTKQKITNPFPVQAQCLPCIMAGRDVIGIAKTGSGKTLAYLLPMLRHIGDQPDLGVGESGPIGLVLAPARELAAQIHSVCKVFVKQLGMKMDRTDSLKIVYGNMQ
mmetsp:Transcript_26623/g.35582  ORF Transcript_26623/g.35582 Transcript_26623/m.35582 type:complete len:601 (-) Transcript_26623:662-2464(-)